MSLYTKLPLESALALEPAYSKFVAPLALDSIYKSLHNYMESNTDPVTICVGVVDQALLEFSRHGRLVFEKHQSLLYRVCARAGIAHMIPNLHFDYEYIISLLFERQFSKASVVLSYGDPAALECDILLDEQDF